MKDIYRAIGLSQDADTAQIKEKVAALRDSDLAGDAACVLLNAGKRKVYTSNLHFLYSMRELRRKLGVRDSEAWLAMVRDLPPDRATG